jgi:hypothetical protein
MQEADNGAGAGGVSSTRQGGDKLTAMLLGSDVECYTTVDQVQGIIRAGGKVDAGRAFTRVLALNKRKEELKDQEVRARRERTREERKSEEEEDNKSDAASSNPRP